MKSLIKFFASNNTFALLFSAMLILLGLKSIITTPKNMFPNVDFGVVAIYTIYPNASPQDVELGVTNKIEEQIDGIAGIKEYVSSSLEGVSRVKIDLDPDVNDEDEVVQRIRDAVNSISDLPTEVDQRPTIIRLDSSYFPFLDIGFASNTLSYNQLRNEARKFKNKLLNITGVSRVETFGLKDREFHIEINPDKLRNNQIPLNLLAETIRNRSIQRKLGTLKHPSNEKSIVTLAELKSIEALENVILRSTYEGRLIKIKDVATVTDTFEDSHSEARFNGIKGILFTTFKTENADMIEIAKKVKSFIKEENKKNPNLEISYTRDMSRYLNNRYNVVKNNGSLGLLFLLIVLGIFLNIRTAFWVGISIPVIVYAVFWLLPFFVPHIDIISLAAFIIVMGIIVDDSIIISENILRRREMGDSPLNAAINGVSEVFGPVLTTILTTLMAFAPMFFMPGIIGKFIFVIPLVITLALIVSFFEVTIALPAHIVPTIKKVKSNDSHDPWFNKLKNPFQKLVQRTLNKRYILVISYILLFFISIAFTLKYKEFVLFPAEQAENIFVECEMPIGTSFETTSKKITEIEAIINTLPKQELDAFTTKVGIKGRDEDTASESSRHSQMALYLTPYSQRSRTADEIATYLRERTKNIAGINVKFNVAGGGPPVGRPLEIRIRHFDNKKRASLTQDIVDFLTKTPGVYDLERNDILEKDRLVIEFNEERIARLGFSLTHISQAISTALNGQIVTSVRLDDEDIDYRIIFNEKSRYELDQLKKLTISNNQNRLIPLGQLVSFNQQPGIPNFYHINGKRTTTLAANIDKSITTPIALYKTLKKTFDTPEILDGGTLSFGGESEETNQSFQDLFKTFLIALLGIYFLLVLLFSSFTQPIMIVSCIPLGLIGVILAFTLHNQNLGFFSMLGSIGLIGVLVNDSLVLVHRINALKAENPKAPIQELVAQGTADRFRPILLTSLTTVAGVLPLAYGLGGSDPFIAPMGLALGYGLLFSTPLILFYVPCCYLIHDDIQKWIQRKIKQVLKTKIT